MLTSLGVRPTVVLADDHPGMLAEILKFLQPHCQIVATVENGILAVHAISEWRPDIAILDIAMPGIAISRIAISGRHSLIACTAKTPFSTVATI